MRDEDLQHPDWEWEPLEFDQGTVSAEPDISYSAEEVVLKNILDQLAGLASLRQLGAPESEDGAPWLNGTPAGEHSPDVPRDRLWDELLDGQSHAEDDPFWA